MKKGCFIKTVVILTILVASILYIVRNKLDDFILIPGKSILKGYIEKKINNELEFVKQTPEKDSLKVILDEYISNLKKVSTLNEDSLQTIVRSVKDAVDDSIITRRELIKIKKYLLHKSENERSKKN